MKKRVPLNRSRECKHSKCTLLCTRFLTMGVLSVCFSGQDPDFIRWDGPNDNWVTR